MRTLSRDAMNSHPAESAIDEIVGEYLQAATPSSECGGSDSRRGEAPPPLVSGASDEGIGTTRRADSARWWRDVL